MQIDVGTDSLASLSYEDQAEIARAGARLGYGAFWTTGGADPFQTCVLRWAESRRVAPAGIATAIGVLPVGMYTPASLATNAAAASKLTGGRFILGIGSGSVHSPAYRRTWGVESRSSLDVMRGYLTVLRGLLAGESVSYDGPGFRYESARLPNAVPSPVYIGALGPAMLRLAGELADGVCLSWSSAAQIENVRRSIDEGARGVSRGPAQVTIATYVRVSIDEDVAAARRALASAMLNYAIGWPGAPGPAVYPDHFARMGYGEEVGMLQKLRKGGASDAELVEAFPESLLADLGYYGPSEGAAVAVQRLAGTADVAIVRIVPSRPGRESVVAIMEACAPGR